MAAFAFGLCLALGVGKSREATAIMMVAAMSVISASVFVYNNIIIQMGVGQTVAPQYSVTIFENLWHNWPFIIMMYVMVFLVDQMYKRGNTLTNVKEHVMEESSKLGPMSMDEKKATVVCIAILAFLMTESLHGIPAGWGLAAGALLLFFPGINIGTDGDVREVNFAIAFLVPAFMAMGGVAGFHGWGVQLGEMFMPLLANATDTGVVMLVVALLFLVNLVLTPMAITFALTAPLTEVALEIGLNPIVIWYLINHAVDLVIIPHQIVLYLVFFSFGLMYLSDFIKISLMKILVNIIFIPLIIIPWWRIVGLL